MGEKMSAVAGVRSMPPSNFRRLDCTFERKASSDPCWKREAREMGRTLCFWIPIEGWGDPSSRAFESMLLVGVVLESIRAVSTSDLSSPSPSKLISTPSSSSSESSYPSPNVSHALGSLKIRSARALPGIRPNMAEARGDWPNSMDGESRTSSSAGTFGLNNILIAIVFFAYRPGEKNKRKGRNDRAEGNVQEEMNSARLFAQGKSRNLFYRKKGNTVKLERRRDESVLDAFAAEGRGLWSTKPEILKVRS